MANRDRLKLELQRARGPFLVLAILAVCAVVVSAVLISKQTFQRPWERYTQVRVAFDDVKGVVPGQQEVRIAGVKVGLVKASELVGDRAVLTLAVEEKYAPIYRDATFRLRPKTPLQDMYVELRRGTRRAGVLRAGQIVPAAQTVTPVDVSRVLQTFDGDTRLRLRTLLDGFGRGLDGRGTALEQSFVELAPFLTTAEALAHQLAVRRTRLRRLVSATGGLTSELARHDRDLSRLITTGDATLATLARRDVPLAQTIRELPGTVSSLQRSLTALGGARRELDPALTALRPAAQKLGPALGALDRVSADLRPAAQDLLPAVRALRPLATVLPATAAGLRGTASALRPQLPDVDLALRQLQACETPFARFFSWTLSVLKFRDAYSSYPRGTLTAGLDSLYDNKSGITGQTKSRMCSTLAGEVAR
jgi:virulence factor Mce-like protein